uniref:Abortive infection protein n=1 Tax=Chlorobium chlorochromatii (strain CaD3) TaxID=340177 RepID=Q3ARP4_CHLCH
MSVTLMIFIYWAIAIAIGFIFFKKDILSFEPKFDGRRIGLLIASLLIIALNAWVYSHSTSDGGRSLDPLTLLVFSVGNGIAETFMFYAVFRFGTSLVGRFTQNAVATFLVGFLCFVVYSGLIHGLFWINILPEHVVQTSPYKPFFMPVQMLIAGSWALNFFWYRDIRTVIFLHGLVDLTMAWNVKFDMF